jgi:hypothetical protein
MFLGARSLTSLKRAIAFLLLGVWASFSLNGCSKYNNNRPSASSLHQRVLASQGVTSTTDFGALIFVNGLNDTLAPIAPLSAGTSPTLEVVSPSRNILAAFDSAGNAVYATNTVSEAAIGRVQLPGPTTSMVVPTASPIGYAAVPSAPVTGFPPGAVEVMNFGGGSIATSIAVSNAQTVVSDSTGTNLLVFNSNSSAASDYITVITPANALPPFDTSCYSAPNLVCKVIHGFDQPVYAVVNGSTAYVLNCGPQCGGTQASVAVFDLGSLTITNTIPVDAATWAFLNGSTLYVAGTSPSSTNNGCTGQTTAATTCGRLDIINVTSGTVTGSVVITDGYHDAIDLSANGQLYIGSLRCTNIGNVNFPSGEVRGCLSILNTNTGSVVIPPVNGNVTGLQSFTQRDIEYVAQDGTLYVYDTTKNILLINDFLPLGKISIVGSVGDIKAIDFF